MDSSLPIGGENTHCVMTGHRGLASARLFTRLDELKEGDEFFLEVLGEKLAYKVEECNLTRRGRKSGNQTGRRSGFACHMYPIWN